MKNFKQFFVWALMAVVIFPLTTLAIGTVGQTIYQLEEDLNLNGFALDFPTTPDIDDVITDDTLAAATDTNLATALTVKTYIDGLIGAIDQPECGDDVCTVNIMFFDDSESCATGNGAGDVFYNFPYTNYDLTEVVLTNQTAGTTGTMSVQVRNVTQGANMLSTAVTTDSGEKTSMTAATPYVIDGSNDDITKGEEVRIDVGACHTTPALGGQLILYFTKQP